MIIYHKFLIKQTKNVYKSVLFFTVSPNQKTSDRRKSLKLECHHEEFCKIKTTWWSHTELQQKAPNSDQLSRANEESVAIDAR